MSTSAVHPICRTCGLTIEGPTHLIWNGHHYHTDHLPSREPPPVIAVAALQLDDDSPGLWIGFKTAADREAAMKWFCVETSRDARASE